MEQHLQHEESPSYIAETPQTQDEAQNREEVMEADLAQAREREATLAQLQQQTQVCRNQARILNGIYTFLNGLYLLFFVNSSLRWWNLPHVEGTPDVMSMLLPLILLQLIVNGAISAWKKSARNLARLDDIRSVGTLAEAFDMKDRDLQKTARTALTRLLPRLSASDTRLLNNAQRANLYRRLDGRFAFQDVDFTQALLKALEQIGDDRAVSYVEKLAAGSSKRPKRRRVIEAAQACLPYLRERAEQQRVSATLLRASSATSPSAATLLRPASGSAETDPAQLLRASGNQP